MTRTRLTTRHTSVTTNIHWTSPNGIDQKFVVTYGFDDKHQIREVFCAGFKAGTDLVAFANDACILLSRLLQHGEHLADISKTLGENRQEGQTQGPPASVLGAIVRKGMELHG